MTSLLRSYNRFVLRNPLLAMSLTTGTTMGLGNIVSQTIMEKRTLNNLDWPRITKFAAYGYLFSGPVLRYWYYGLDKYFAGARFKPVKMMLADQIIIAPIFNSTVLLYLSLASGKSWADTKKRFRQEFPTVIKANYAVWPAIQLTNFYFIPIQHRVLFVNVCSLIWSTFLAFVTK